MVVLLRGGGGGIVGIPFVAWSRRLGAIIPHSHWCNNKQQTTTANQRPQSGLVLARSEKGQMLSGEQTTKVLD